ncbi:MAG: glycosyltransferase family 2 protein [Gammaproteobacteria bacterium]|nr:glycosyltransferase family 2 protein [Gammaproteobacteria bacterium]MBU1653550.1 glycosyltransferase family 2 protein [Gammaproteobacteria bacterium]MBU1961892.1 glycosyltransferase family 2 protein [Gammaproteobacteria bacterium]
MPVTQSDISVLLVNYNTRHLLAEMFEALDRASEGLSVETILLDNASADGSVGFLRSAYPEMELIENPVNVGFGRANNQCLARSRGRYILLLNTDAFLAPDSLAKTLAYMEANPRCGVLGARLVGRDGNLQPSCRYFPTPWNLFLARTGLDRLFKNARLVDDMAWDHASVRPCDWVPGCFYLTRREVLDRVGLFDPRYFLYYEEVDHCKAVKAAGWEVVYFPDTSVVHIGGESARSEGELSALGRQIEALQIESELLYFRKNHGRMAVLLDVVLTTLADLIIPLKRLIRGKRSAGLIEYLKHIGRVWRTFAHTRWGLRPTR